MGEASVLALCTTLPESSDLPVVGVPDGWITYRDRHACSVPCVAAIVGAQPVERRKDAPP